MIFALACAALLLATLAVLLAPLLRRRDAGAANPDQEVYRAQLAELEQDRARGLIGAEEAGSARTEIARRLLATASTAVPIPPGRPNPRFAGVLAVLLTLVGGGLYVINGAPGLQPQPATGQAALAAQAASLAAATARNPNDVEAWLNYGRASAALGRWSDAVAAYRKVLTLRPAATPVLAALGEALTMEAGGTITPEARAAFAAAPAELASRFYLAQADAQSGKAEAAIAGWQALAADLPADAPVRAELARRIGQAATAAGLPVPALAPAGPGPDAAAMGRAMVARLAERLAAAPDDAEGWLRLGRAYLVLNEPDKSADAYDRAAALRPGEAARLQQIAALFETTPIGTPLPPRLRALVEEVAARAPNQPEILWYQGMLAARSGQRDAALRHWQALLPLLPAASEERRLVQTAIDALTKP